VVTQALSPNENAFKFGDDKISPSVLDPTATTILVASTSQTEMSLAVQIVKIQGTKFLLSQENHANYDGLERSGVELIN